MKRIFIDANGYLLFYNSRKEFQKPLELLESVKDQIFIPKQVVYEVRRNSYTLFERLIKEYLKYLTYKSFQLPAHIIADTKSIKDWNKKRAQINKGLDLSNRRLETLLFKELQSLYEFNDEVSNRLKPLFEACVQESPEELDIARLRKERGNPPGKSTDPLGDQLSWTQFLTQVDTSESEVWIITSDRDYSISLKKKLLIHPFLFSELKKKNKKIKVNCFDSLIDGLSSYNNKYKIKDFPKEAQLKEIKIEEIKIRSEQQQINTFIPTSGTTNINYGLTSGTGTMGLASSHPGLGITVSPPGIITAGGHPVSVNFGLGGTISNILSSKVCSKCGNLFMSSNSTSQFNPLCSNCI